jgi:3-oxoacyl-[acyl-carrier protein] reductase
VFRLDLRTAIVTGATGGIGAATALALTEQGADIVLAVAPGERAAGESLADQIRGGGHRALVVEADVRSTDDVARLVARTLDDFGRLDVLVANAGVLHRAPTTDLADEDWSRVLDTNLSGVFRCFRAVLPVMKTAGWGRLLATSSISGALWGSTQHPHYAASKAGLVGLVRSVAIEAAPHGITVNAVAPGVIETAQSLDPVNSLGPAGVERVGRTLPVGRVGTGHDVGALFAFLASDEAAFMTGQTLLLDGGAGLGGY